MDKKNNLAPNNSWRSKRVLVTGGHGFVGSKVVSRLSELRAHVISPTHLDFDLTDVTKVRELLSQCGEVDVVIHLAATVGGIGANLEHPGSFFYDNIMMGTNMMHESYLHGIKKFVGIGTVCSYPKITPVPFKEEDIWNGYPEETNAPYGLAKKMMLVQSKGYREEYGWNSINLLMVNVYGPGDNFDPSTSHVIPALIKKCIDAIRDNKQRIEIWGDGTATREFLFVDDAVEGILMGAESYNSSEPVNLGSGNEISISDLVLMIARVTGYNGEIWYDHNKPNGQPRRLLDNTKAKKEFGFSATTSFEIGIQKTVEWYKTQLEGR